MAAFKPVYLLHGDDHGGLAERRARLRALAEAESGAHGLELFEGDAATPDAVAAALETMTFAIGRRFLIVDGVERWKDGDLAPLLAVLEEPPPETTVAFFAREDGRQTAPARLAAAVRGAGGDVVEQRGVKPWELPRWVAEQARGLGIALAPGAPQALVARVGERQQQLLRALERLALELGQGVTIGADEIEELLGSGAEQRVWALADALVAGDAAASTSAFLALRAQGERLPGLIHAISQRLRSAADVAWRLEAGESAAAIRRTLRPGGKAADRLVAAAGQAGSTALRHAVERVADLELASRGWPPGGLREETLALRAFERIEAEVG
jgi:DNA polymerase-3 subunit delta